MPDKFDPYREALVMENITVWPSDFDHLGSEQKAKIEAALHAAPSSCDQLEYIRQHSGFCRQITVTAEDVERVSA